MSYVNIVISDRSWIIERLAKKITDKLGFVRYDDRVDPDAFIQYYLTYSKWQGRISPLEIGFFTHHENDPNASAAFFRAAHGVDHCVCMSRPYAEMLRDDGVRCVSVIAPGVDLDRFRPRLRIGVVGRTYHTGRKGEALVASLMDLPDIDWFFTGEGWPGPALNLPEDELPGFYRSLDYVLVPSFYEGGPMCVPEALASGVPVIAPPIGWIPDFPHIDYPVGDRAALRQILAGLLREKAKLRASVLDRTWDNWVEHHDALFRRLMKRGEPTSVPPSEASRVKPVRAVLLTHGLEAETLGGPSVRAPRTAAALTKINVDARSHLFPTASVQGADLVHGFNVWPIGNMLAMQRQAKRLDIPFAFSPILLDLSGLPFWQDTLPALFQTTGPDDRDRLDAAISAARTSHQTLHEASAHPPEPEPGYNALVREAINASDHVIFLSEHERHFASQLGAVSTHSSIVHNPVDAAHFSGGDPTLFRNAYGVKDYVLCVARVEFRKNQLMLLHALRDTGIPVVLIGHLSDEVYSGLVRARAQANVHIIGRMDYGSDMLRSAIAGARVFTLPSWAEGAPLAALEAGAAGSCMVLSNQSAEKEYFDGSARYCDPGDPASIRDTILEAYHSNWGVAQRQAVAAHVAQRFSWEQYARETRQAYNEMLSEYGPRRTPARRTAVPPKAEVGPSEIIFDLTTSAQHSRHRSGIVRVEKALASGLTRVPGILVRYVVWNQEAQGFRNVPQSVALGTQLTAYMLMNTASAPQAYQPGASLVVVGSGWMQNEAYAEALGDFAHQHDLRLSVLMHDMTPLMFPFWFGEGYSKKFEKNLRTLLTGADRILVYSENTRRDVKAAALDLDVSLGSTHRFRLSDEISVEGAASLFGPADTTPPLPVRGAFAGRRFILNVGAIHARKNHRILYDVWLLLAKQLGEQCPHLVIVGGVAWNGADLARTFKEDSRISRFLHVVDDVEDTDLEWLYLNCLFTVYPSLYEGWGLPVGESLAYGKLCIASDVSSLPEIAPGLIDLLEPLDVKAWLTRILFYVSSASARAAREAEIKSRFKATTWLDSARLLAEAVQEPLELNDRHAYSVGERIHLGQINQALRIKRGGWFATETWGTWSANAHPGLRVRLVSKPAGDLLLIVAAGMLASKAVTREAVVSVNGKALTKWFFTDADQTVRVAYVPSDLLADGVMNIQFQLDRMETVANFYQGSKDARAVGLSLTRFALVDGHEPVDAASYVGLTTATSVRLTSRSIDVSSPENFKAAFLSPRTVAHQHGWGLIAESGRLAIVADVQDHLGLDLTLSVRARAVAAPERPLDVLVIINGEHLDQWTFNDDTVTVRKVLIPTGVRTRQQPMTVELFSYPVVSPADLGVGASKTRFSLGISELRFDVVAPDRAAVLPPTGLIECHPGTKLSFGQQPLPGASSGVALLDGGWCEPEERGVWSYGAEAQLRFRLPRDVPNGLVAVVVARAFNLPVSSRELRLTANGQAVGHMSLHQGEFAVGTFDIGAVLHGATDVLIGFGINFNLALHKLGLSADERPLGFYLQDMLLLCLHAISFPFDERVGSEAFERQAVLINWHSAEADGTRWSSAADASIVIRPEARFVGSPLQITLPVDVLVATAGAPRPLTILLGDTRLAEYEFTDDSHIRLRVLVPSKLSTPILTLTLRQTRPFQPIETGHGNDPRTLGVRLHSFMVSTYKEDRYDNSAREAGTAAETEPHDIPGDGVTSAVPGDPAPSGREQPAAAAQTDGTTAERSTRRRSRKRV